MQGDLKQTFILRAVQNYLDILMVALPAALKRKKIGVTDDLLNSIRTQASKSGSGAIGKLIFDESGRMIDMGVGRGNPLGGLKAVRETLLSTRQTGTYLKAQGRKPKKWYSPVAYGKLGILENELMYGFTEEVKNELLKMGNNAV